MRALSQRDAFVDSPGRGIFEIVRKAWVETAGVAFDPQQSWQETGADSMTSLQLLLALEQALARRLSFDLIDPEMTGHDLARSLQQLVDLERHEQTERIEQFAPLVQASGDTGAPSSAAAAPRQPPSIFLVPGIHGDEPRLADFRRAFGGRVRFEVIGLPELCEPARLLADMAASGRHAAREIERRQPGGALLLAGYSFGGAVAFEAARHLQAGGRAIAWLAILDTRFAGAPWQRPWWRLDLQLIRLVAPIDSARRALLAAVRGLAPARSIRVRQLLFDQLRHKAMRRWQAAPLGVPALIAASTQTDAAMVARWLELCPGAELLRLSTGHFELFRPPALQMLLPVFEAAVSDAMEVIPATRATSSAPASEPVPATPMP